MTDRTTTGTQTYGYSKTEPTTDHEEQSKGGRVSRQNDTNIEETENYRQDIDAEDESGTQS